MDYLDTIAGQARFAATNIAYNLDYIPADKFDWKPAPTANSALEIINHVLAVFKRMEPILAGGEMSSEPATLATNAADAKQLLLAAVEKYVAALRAVPPESLSKPVTLRFGTLPLARVAGMPILDLVHHHGQIAYIQELLGDTETHFDPALFKA